MKQYKKYMDNIQASDTLHQRLLNLKAPQKRAPVWNKYKGVAAVLAGACALLLQWGVREGNDPAMGTYQIRASLIRGCLRRPDMVYPNNQWGYGSVQLMQSFHLMREL